VPRLLTPYPSEKHLVESVSSQLSSGKSPWPPLALSHEFNFVGGRADIIALDAEGRVLAFEAKLSRWRSAVNQAYKNTAFAHFSYVVLPEPSALVAAQAPEQFRLRSIGLCAACPDGLAVVFEAPQISPLLPGLTTEAAQATTQP